MIRAISADAEELTFAEFCDAHRAWLRLRDSVVDGASEPWKAPPEWNAIPRRHPRVSYGPAAIDDFIRVAAGETVCVWEEGARGGWRAHLISELDRFEIASMGVHVYVVDPGARWVFVLTMDQVSSGIGPFFVSAPDEAGED